MIRQVGLTNVESFFVVSVPSVDFIIKCGAFDFDLGIKRMASKLIYMYRV